jgi:hypothetical protein
MKELQKICGSDRSLHPCKFEWKFAKAWVEPERFHQPVGNDVFDSPELSGSIRYAIVRALAESARGDRRGRTRAERIVAVMMDRALHRSKPHRKLLMQMFSECLTDNSLIILGYNNGSEDWFWKNTLPGALFRLLLELVPADRRGRTFSDLLYITDKKPWPGATSGRGSGNCCRAASRVTDVGERTPESLAQS